MMQVSSLKLGHPDQKRLLILLVCMAFGVILLGALGLYRYRVIENHRARMVTEQTHSALVQALRLELHAARLALHRLALVRDPQGLTIREKEVDAALMRAKGILVLMHQGGELRSRGGAGSAESEAFVLPSPMPPELLTEASRLVPLVQDMLDHGAAMTRELLRFLGSSEGGTARDTMPVEDRVEPLFEQADAVSGRLASAISRRMATQISQHQAHSIRVAFFSAALGGVLILVMAALCLRSMRAVASIDRKSVV